MKNQVQTQKTTKNGTSNNSKKGKAVKLAADELADLGLGEDDAEMKAYIAEQNAEVEEMGDEAEETEELVPHVEHKPIVQAKVPEPIPLVTNPPNKKAPLGAAERFIDTSDFDAQFEADLKKVATNPKEFLDLIATARANGAEHIEATDKVMAYYNKGIVPATGYFIYQNVKVFEEGKYKETMKRINATLY